MAKKNVSIDAGPIHMSRADVIMLTLAKVAAVAGGMGVRWARNVQL